MLSPTMLFITIALILVSSIVSSRELPKHTVHSHRHHRENMTTPNNVHLPGTKNTTVIVDNSKAISSTPKPNEITFHPDVILIHSKEKNQTIKTPKDDGRKTASIDKNKKSADAGNTPITSLNSHGVKPPVAMGKPEQVTHLLTKNPESINLTTRKLFERDDYGPNAAEKKEKIV